jgi:hypothetical protein
VTRAWRFRLTQRQQLGEAIEPCQVRRQSVISSMSLLNVLARCRELSQASQDAVWSSTGVAEIGAILDRGIKLLESGAELNRDELKLLFAPTGALQETAIDNGWSDEYLLLSAEFDELME